MNDEHAREIGAMVIDAMARLAPSVPPPGIRADIALSLDVTPANGIDPAFFGPWEIVVRKRKT